MGSQYMSLHVVDPALVQARLRGDFPDLVDSLYRAEKKPAEALRPAFDLMARGLFVFLAKGQTRPDGLMYCRAVEYLLESLGSGGVGLEFYPDEGEYALWELAFGRCDATWLDLPHSDSGIGVMAWKSPDTCRRLAGSMRHALATQSFNARYSPKSTLEEAIEVLGRGSSSDHGVFAIFQG